jgi:flagellar biosynthesis protein FlhG
VTFAAGSTGVGKSVSGGQSGSSAGRAGQGSPGGGRKYDDGIAAFYGVITAYDLQQVVDREKVLAEVLLAVAPGIRVLPAARLVKQLAGSTMPNNGSCSNAWPR